MHLFIQMSDKKFKIRLSETSPSVKSTTLANQRLLSHQLNILHEEQFQYIRKHKHQRANLEHELQYSVQPRSINLSELDIPERDYEYGDGREQGVKSASGGGGEKLGRQISHGDLAVSAWIPVLQRTARVTAREAGIGNRVFAMTHTDHHTSYRRDGQ